MPRAPRLIKVFTPSFADDGDTNAQNLTAKEVVARLDPERYRVTMFFEQDPDPRIAARPNTILWKWRKRANSASTLLRMLVDVPDVYFFPREGPLDDSFFLARRRLRWHTKVVTYIVSGGLDQVGPRPGQLRNLRQADAAFGNSRYITHLLNDKLGFLADTIYDGVDRRYYFPAESKKVESTRGLVVLCAGSFRPRKRFDLVIRQAARWPQVRFRLAGCGEEEESCRRLASELNCKNVEFLGHLGQAGLGDEMRRADVFLFPSDLEGHPQVLLQATACGLPCVAMKSYQPDAVVDGETGFLASDAEDLAQKFDKLVTSDALRMAMSTAAVRHGALFDWDRVTEQWAQAFEKVIGVGA
ncbi:MAG: glycosyltransferase family 4 protein [Acidobacteria bacterium]|nr:glycosyltransferase family 4 protein [Acidobacteriota bacterium]